MSKQPELLTDFPQYIRDKLHSEYQKLKLPDFLSLLAKMKQLTNLAISYKSFVDSMNVLTRELFEKRYDIEIGSDDADAIVYFEGGPHIEVHVDEEKQKPVYWMIVERSEYESDDLWLLVYRLYLYLAEHYYGMSTDSITENIRYMLAKELHLELNQVTNPDDYNHMAFQKTQYERVEFLLRQWKIKIAELTAQGLNRS